MTETLEELLGLAIPLTQRKYAIIDPGDYELISRHTWHVHKLRYVWYARTNVPHPDEHYRTDGRKNWAPMSMHTLISGYKLTDHRNGNGLDNRRSNLRSATPSQNGVNIRRQKNNSSGHVGVYWNRLSSKWHAQIFMHYDRYHLGFYVDLDDAITAYHDGARQLFGEFAPRCCEQRRVS